MTKEECKKMYRYPIENCYSTQLSHIKVTPGKVAVDKLAVQKEGTKVIE